MFFTLLTFLIHIAQSVQEYYPISQSVYLCWVDLSRVKKEPPCRVIDISYSTIWIMQYLKAEMFQGEACGRRHNKNKAQISQETWKQILDALLGTFFCYANRPTQRNILVFSPFISIILCCFFPCEGNLSGGGGSSFFPNQAYMNHGTVAPYNFSFYTDEVVLKGACDLDMMKSNNYWAFGEWSLLKFPLY